MTEPSQEWTEKAREIVERQDPYFKMLEYQRERFVEAIALALSQAHAAGMERAAREVRALEKWVVEEDDGGPVGNLIDLPDGSQIWSGEVSDDLMAKQGDDTKDALGDVSGGGYFVTLAIKGQPVEVVCRAASCELAMEIVRLFAADAIRKEAGNV